MASFFPKNWIQHDQTHYIIQVVEKSQAGFRLSVKVRMSKSN